MCPFATLRISDMRSLGAGGSNETFADDVDAKQSRMREFNVKTIGIRYSIIMLHVVRQRVYFAHNLLYLFCRTEVYLEVQLRLLTEKLL